MDKANLTPREHQIRMAVRNFLMVATVEQLEREVELSLERNDHFRAACVRELLAEIEEGKRK